MPTNPNQDYNNDDVVTTLALYTTHSIQHKYSCLKSKLPKNKQTREINSISSLTVHRISFCVGIKGNVCMYV